MTSDVSALRRKARNVILCAVLPLRNAIGAHVLPAS